MKATGRIIGGAALGAAGVGAAAALALGRINRIRTYNPDALRRLRAQRSNALFDAFPNLADRLPWMALGDFPTPVTQLIHPQVGTPVLVKRDDGSARPYGGNKVRKLEFLLADAVLAGADLVITMGGHGSNHALATALHARQAGLDAELLLYPQPDLPVVRRNYRAMLDAGAVIHPVGGIPQAFVRAGQLLAQHRLAGRRPRFIMVGGSSRLGAMGHVAAALELADQLRTAGTPSPERIFVPLGTCGTAVGLIVGCRLAGLPTVVTAVRVADPFPANGSVVLTMANDLARTLHRLDPAIPLLRIQPGDFEVLTGYLGAGYGVPTLAGEQAVATVDPLLSLETTYTGKTLAACLDAVRHEPGLQALFWNTYNSIALPPSPGTPEGPAALRHLTRAPGG